MALSSLRHNVPNHRRHDVVDNMRGTTMPDKSPQRPAGKKAGKTLKEKREAKRSKQETKRTIPS